MDLRGAARALGPGLWFLGLAVLVAGPLLGSGYLLLLDWPSGPRFAEPVWFPLPSSGDLGNGAPLNTLHALARVVHPYLPDKLFLLLPIILGGFGVYRLARGRLGTGAFGALFGGTLFVVNPFVLDRYLAGHLHIVLAYSLLPWAAAPLYDVSQEPSRRPALLIGLWMGILAAIDVHIAGMYALLTLIVFLAGSGTAVERLRSGATAFVIGLLLSAYWLLPAILTPPGGGIGGADLEVYASRPRGFGVLPPLAGMYGFWRDEFMGPAQRIPALYLLLIPILGIVVVGLVRLLEPGRTRRFGVALVGTGGLALLLAAGTSFPPTAGAFRWLFDHVFYFRIYREPQKFLALVVLAYAVIGAVGLSSAIARVPALLAGAASAASVLAVLAYGYTMLWGFWGQARLSTYPEDWYQAERAMAREGPGRLLVFPWHLYAVWSFSDGRIVANPAPSFFDREVLVSEEAGFEEVQEQSLDPFTIYVDQVLGERDLVQVFGHLVAPLGVRYVALLNEVNHDEYRYLNGEADLRPLIDSETLTVFENTAWAPPPIGFQEGRTIRSVTELIRTGEEETVTQLFYDAEPPVSENSGGIPGLAQYLPSAEEVGPVDAPFLLTDKRCTDGWRLDTLSPRCHLGTVAGFTSPNGGQELARYGDATRAAGLALSALGVLTCVFKFRRRETSR